MQTLPGAVGLFLILGIVAERDQGRTSEHLYQVGSTLEINMH